jgi:hypothetical protein
MVSHGMNNAMNKSSLISVSRDCLKLIINYGLGWLNEPFAAGGDGWCRWMSCSRERGLLPAWIICNIVANIDKCLIFGL